MNEVIHNRDNAFRKLFKYEIRGKERVKKITQALSSLCHKKIFFNIKEADNAYNRADHQKVKCCEKHFDKISIFIVIEYLIIINSIRFNANTFRISSTLKSIFLLNLE